MNRENAHLHERRLMNGNGEDGREPQWYLERRLKNYRSSARSAPQCWQRVFEALIMETERQMAM
jgi:hypothetical protein